MTEAIQKRKLAIIGVGNTLAGDDGAGIEVIRHLQALLGEEDGVLLHTLEGDLLEIAELLDRAERFVFVDAFAGDSPGEIQIFTESGWSLAPSLHQMDIGAVMAVLKRAEVANPFPEWEVWGINIVTPVTLGEGLSPEVERAVADAVDRLRRLAKKDGRVPRSLVNSAEGR